MASESTVGGGRKWKLDERRVDELWSAVARLTGRMAALEEIHIVPHVHEPLGPGEVEALDAAQAAVDYRVRGALNEMGMGVGRAIVARLAADYGIELPRESHLGHGQVEDLLRMAVVLLRYQIPVGPEEVVERAFERWKETRTAFLKRYAEEAE